MGREKYALISEKMRVRIPPGKLSSKLANMTPEGNAHPPVKINRNPLKYNGKI